MHQDWKIECKEVEYVKPHIRVANCRFGNLELQHCHWMAREVFWAEVALVLVLAVCVGWVKVHQSLCTSSVSANSFGWSFGSDGSHPCGFDEAQLGFFPSQSSPVYAQDTQLPAYTLPILRCEVWWLGVAFLPLQPVDTPLRPVWPYSRRGTCQTVLAVPDLLALS